VGDIVAILNLSLDIDIYNDGQNSGKASPIIAMGMVLISQKDEI